MFKAPFKIYENGPKPLQFKLEREARFDEVDMMKIVWHGRYVSYLEEVRVALGNHYNMGYMDFYQKGFAVPIKKIDIDYKMPLMFQDKFSIQAIWHWCPSARINIEYIIKNSSGDITTVAYTVQLFIKHDGAHVLYPPDYYSNFLTLWEAGKFECGK